MAKFSVLLLYPDHMNDSGNETYYDFTEAKDPAEAAENVQRIAAKANAGSECSPQDFIPLLVLHGHHDAELYGRDL